jgi:hypothetical protein
MEVDELLDLLVEQATATVDDIGQLHGVTHERVDEDPEAAQAQPRSGHGLLAGLPWSQPAALPSKKVMPNACL